MPSDAAGPVSDNTSPIFTCGVCAQAAAESVIETPAANCLNAAPHPPPDCIEVSLL